MMRTILAAARKDLRARVRDPLAFVLWLGIPLAIGGLLTLASGGGSGIAPRSPLYVADHDDTFVSKALGSAFEQGPLGKLFRVEKLDEAAARARLVANEGSALVVIPAGFARAVLREEPARLELVKNPAQRILPGIAAEVLAMLPDAVFYLHRVLGPELALIAAQSDEDEGPDEEQVVAISLAVRRAVERMDKYLFPPVIALETVSGDDAGKPAMDLGAAFFPAMLFLALIFMCQGLTEDLWKEKTQGALRRLASTPAGLGPILLGKLLAALVTALPVAAVGLVFGWASFGLAGRNLLPACLWILGACALFWLIFTWIQLLATSERGASVLGNLILFPLAMIGGCFFPFESMPEWMQRVGRWTPNGWTLLEFKAIVAGRADAAHVAGSLGVLLLLCVPLFWVAARRFGGRFLGG